MSGSLIMESSGRIKGVRPQMLWTNPYFLMTDQQVDQTLATPVGGSNQVVVPANGTVGPVFMGMPPDGAFRAVILSCLRTGPCRVLLQIQDGGQQVGLMNSGVHIDTLFGNTAINSLPGFQGYRLPEGLVVPAGQGIEATLYDISGSTNYVRLVAEGVRNLKPSVVSAEDGAKDGAQPSLSLPFWYTTDNGPVTVPAGYPLGTVFDFPLTIAQAHNFALHQMSGIFVQTGTTTPATLNINILETNRGESLISAPSGTTYGISSDLLFGNANFPFKFHEPRLLSSGTRIMMRLSHRSAAQGGTGGTTAVDAHITLGGHALAIKGYK